MKTKTWKRLAIVLTVLILVASASYFGFGYALDRRLESKGLRKLIGEKTARLLDMNAGYLPLASDLSSISSRGFLALGSPPCVLTEMRASHLQAPCNIIDLWHDNWRIDHLRVQHLQAAYGAEATQLINRNEFPVPELMAPLQTDPPIKVDLRDVDIARTDLFWGRGPEQGGEFRNVHTNLYPRDQNLLIDGNGGTFHQVNWPVVQVQQIKVVYAKPDLRIDEGSLTFGGRSSISVLGSFRFEQETSFDVNLTFARCPVAPFLKEAQRWKIEGEFDGTAHLQKEIGHPGSARASGSIAMAKVILTDLETMQHFANFTGREELARLPINQIKADYDWNRPILTVKNFVLESNRLLIIKGEFTIKGNKIDGEFQIGVSPDLVEKFPGAREEVFIRSDEGYLWTKLTLSGTPNQPRNDLKPRLVRAAQNHFATGLVPPTFKPGQTVIEAIEEL